MGGAPVNLGGPVPHRPTHRSAPGLSDAPPLTPTTIATELFTIATDNVTVNSSGPIDLLLRSRTFDHNLISVHFSHWLLLTAETQQVDPDMDDQRQEAAAAFKAFMLKSSTKSNLNL